MQCLCSSKVVLWYFAAIAVLQIPEICLMFPHNIGSSPLIVIVTRLKPQATLVNLTSLIVYCDVTIASIEPKGKDVTAAHLEDPIRTLLHVRPVTFYLCIPKGSPFANLSDPEVRNGYKDYYPPNYNNIAYQFRDKSCRLQWSMPPSYIPWFRVLASTTAKRIARHSQPMVEIYHFN